MACGFYDFALNFIYLLLGIGGNGQHFPPPLNKQEENELFIKVKNEHDMKARSKLIEHNLRLVAHIVRKYYTSYSNPDDLVSIGTLGLIKSIDTFKYENGARFATYAAKCIQNEILMFFRSQKKLSNEVSMNETIDIDRDGNPLTYMDIISGDDTTIDDIDMKVYTERVFVLIRDILDERERTIIMMRYGLGDLPPCTQKEVAKKMDISRSYVSRIEKKALEKLKMNFGPQTPSFDS